MKTLSMISAICGIAFAGAASAANITVYYSPTCPHCHHARDFISNNLVYEYPNLVVSEVNVMTPENAQVVDEAFTKCEYESRGVPVIVVGEKCFQGYADFMQQDLRDAVEADLSDSEKATAAANKKAMEENADAFKQEHADRATAISEYSAANAVKKNDGGSSIWFYGLLVVLVAGLGFVLLKKDNKKK